MQFLQRINTPFNWFFMLFALAGFWFMGDYGVPLDEITQRVIGMENARFIGSHGNADFIRQNGFFGPVLEIVDYWAENLIWDRPIGDKILLRHIILFVIFLLAVRAFYQIALSISTKPLSAGTATVLFALNPVIFAHAHYNSKDTFFLSLVIFSVFFLMRFSQTGKWRFLYAAGIMLGMATTVRLSGLFVAAALVLPVLIQQGSTLPLRLKRTLILTLVAVAAFYLFYPYLWLEPLQGLSALFDYVSQNPWPWPTLAAGQDILPGKMPAWYLPVWMGVTIPLLSILLFIAGLILIFVKKRGLPGFVPLILCLLFAFPFLYFLIFRPTIYNGWRHLQFLIVPVCLLSVYAIDAFRGLKWGNFFPWLASAYSCIVLLMWQPYGYVYFNEIYSITGKPATFDQDYWGLSALQGLQWIVANDKRDSIAVSSFTESPELNAALLPEKDRNRLHFIRTLGEGEYELEVRRDRYFANLEGQEVYTICPLKNTILRVVKLRPE